MVVVALVMGAPLLSAMQNLSSMLPHPFNTIVQWGVPGLLVLLCCCCYLYAVCH